MITFKHTAILLSLTTSLFLASCGGGGGGGGGGGSSTTPLTVASYSYLPAAITAVGGDVDITLTVSGQARPASFSGEAEITAGGTPIAFTLTRVGSTSTYEGTVTVPANGGLSTVNYTATFTVSGVTQSVTGTFDVEAGASPPPPPASMPGGPG